MKYHLQKKIFGIFCIMDELIYGEGTEIHIPNEIEMKYLQIFYGENGCYTYSSL